MGALLKLAGAPIWVSIVVAALGAAAAIGRVGLEVVRSGAEERESREERLRRAPVRVRELAERAGFYEIGVETEAREALRALGEPGKHAPLRRTRG